MKFNITVDLDDFWMDEDSLSFSNELKSFIVGQVKNDIWKDLQKKVEDQISRETKKQIETSYVKKIQRVISDTIANETIKDSYGNGEISIQEYIKNQFKSNSGWNSPNQKIEQLAKVFADDMKKRYDLLFATQIVSKLGENGMLKEDVARLLLDEKN